MDIFSRYINNLLSSHQIDVCQLPAPDAYVVKHAKAPTLVRAALPEPASVAVQKSASRLPRVGHADF
jgi:hypothetical protein